jgi:uncharacterized protein
MQKLNLDTNVIVSALISNSIPTKILHELVLTQIVETCLSDDIYAEYLEVLERGKFSGFTNFNTKALIVLIKLREVSTFFNIQRKIEVLSDLSDNKFLELAAECSADFLVTGNTRDFTISEFEHTKILTPAEYWNLTHQ